MRWLRRLKRSVERWLLLQEILVQTRRDLVSGEKGWELSRIFDARKPRRLFHAQMILFRCIATNLDCVGYVRQGKLRTVQALLKLVIEDTAVALVHAKSGKALDRIDATKSVSALVDLIPPAGRSYGFVNRFSHFTAGHLFAGIEIERMDTPDGLAHLVASVTPRARGLLPKLALAIQIQRVTHSVLYPVLDLVTATDKRFIYWSVPAKGQVAPVMPKDIQNRLDRWLSEFERLGVAED